MNVTTASFKILAQLSHLISQLHDKDYSRPSEALSGSSVGQHLRHTLEFFLCLEQGFETGTVNYDKRAHDKSIESDRAVALKSINRIKSFIERMPLERRLVLEVGYNVQNEDFTTVETNGLRELVYNVEHAVHHMAIMKIGVRDVAGYVNLPLDFGVAASTLRHKEKEVQPAQ